MVLTSGSDAPPLLRPGFHLMTLESLQQLCVDRFPKSKTRQAIMSGLERVVKRIKDAAIRAEVWVNGSFLTEKEDPNDSDVVVKVAASYRDSGTEQQKATLEWVASNLRGECLCHSHVLPIFPEDHELAVLNVYQIAYWIRQFGFSRGEECKGLAVLQIEV